MTLLSNGIFVAVGPVYSDGRRGEPKLLEQCYGSALELAIGRKLESVAFPSISTGAYRFPIEQTCPIALKTTGEILVANEQIQLVRFVLFSAGDLEVYRKTLASLLRAGS